MMEQVIPWIFGGLAAAGTLIVGTIKWMQGREDAAHEAEQAAHSELVAELRARIAEQSARLAAKDRRIGELEQELRDAQQRHLETITGEFEAIRSADD